MNIIIDSEFNTKQKKYNNDFSNDLEVSQELVNSVSEELVKQNIKHRSQDDSVEWKGCSNKERRGADIAISLNGSTNHIDCWFECKDFCRLIAYNGTGLPKEYINKLVNNLGAENVYLIFRDNENYISLNKKNRGMSRDNIVKNLEDSGYMVEKDGKKIFQPYGNRLDILMKNRFNENIEKRILCSWPGRYYKSSQYIFEAKSMIFLPEIIKSIKKENEHDANLF